MGTAVLVARCMNYREDLDERCTGRIRFRWGQSQAACDTCGGYCGIAVAAWERVEAPGAVRVRFWTCKAHRRGRVEWRGDVAHCLETGCGRTSAPAVR